MQWPRDNYILRVIGDGFAPSKSSNNPMITLEFEVVSPEELEIAGEHYVVAGTKLKNYYPTIVMEGDNQNEEKTANAQARVKKLYELFGLPNDSINFENPSLEFRGKLVYALLYDDPSEQRKSPTKEQLAKGQRQGEVLRNPITKQPLISHYPKVGEIFGLAQIEAGKAF